MKPTTTTTREIQIQGMPGRSIFVSCYRNRAQAIRAVESGEASNRVLQGDDGVFWEASAADAELLVEAGYEYAD